MDAEWRTAEDWVCDVTGQRRDIKVKLDGGVWASLPRDTVARLLAWYDHGKLGDEFHGVLGCEVPELYFTYRIEGGNYLTQRNPNRTNVRRECHIILGANTGA